MQVINFIYPERSDIKYHIDTYPDSQKHLVLETELNHREKVGIYIRLSNLDDIWILLQLSDICHRQGIIIQLLNIYYLFAARTDRLFSNNESLDLDIVYKLIKSVKAKEVYILEPHSDRIYDLDTTKTFIKNVFGINILLRNVSGTILLPDQGAYGRYITSLLSDYPVIYADKIRSKDGIKIKINPSLIIPTSPYYIIDDLCDGGGTFITLHNELNKLGVKDIHLKVIHAIQKDALIMLSKLYKTITITNSYKDWNKEELPDNVEVVLV